MKQPCGWLAAGCSVAAVPISWRSQGEPGSRSARVWRNSSPPL